MSKKLLLIGGSIVSLILIIFLVWFLFLRDKNIPAGEAVKDFLPFGSGENLNLPTFPVNPMSEDPRMFDERGVPISNLFRISEAPVAGAVTITRAGQSVVRYVDRATGHIVEVILPQGEELTAVERRKITNTTMPKIYEAYFRADGGAVLLRSLRGDLDVQNNTGLTLSPPTGTSTDGLYGISAAAFRGDMGSVAVQGNNLFYSLKDSKTIVSSTFNSGSPRNLMTSEFTEWVLKPAGTNLVIYTKASQGVMGYAYLLNTTNGSLTKLLGPLEALAVTPNQDGSRLLYSYIINGFPRTAVRTISSGTNIDISPFTLAEKCSWSPNRNSIVYCAVPADGIPLGEPDNWYIGRTSFSDRLLAFDTNSEVAQVLVEPRNTYGLDLDIVSIKITPNEDYLIFTNKRDLSLWALKLE